MNDEENKLNLGRLGEGDLSPYFTTDYSEALAEYKPPLEELGVTEDDLPNLAAKTPELSYPLLISDEYPVKMVFKAYKLDFKDVKEFQEIVTELDQIRGQLSKGAAEIEKDPQLAVGTGLAIVSGGFLGGAIPSGNFASLASAAAGATFAGVTGIAAAGGEENLKNFGISIGTVLDKSVRLTSYENYEAANELVGKVTLPLQRALQYTDRVNYNQGATNFGQGVVGAAGSLISGASGDIKAGTGGLLSQVLSRVAGAGAVAALAKPAGMAGLGALAGAIGAEPLANYAKEASRVTLNPNIRTLFEGVPIRAFSFPFRMVAKSEKEAIEIKKIVKFFRGEVYPEAVDAADLPFTYKFPNVFDIQIKDKFNKNPAFDIQRCYLNSVTTMFNQTATGMYEGKDNNYFIEVDMTLEFIEVATMDKSKVTGADEKGGF